jgi:cytoskeletal protein CcmA (bactofilin family)
MGMFDKTSDKKPVPEPPGGLSIIAVGMTIHGDIDSNGTVKVEGTVDGNVLARNQVLVAKGGVVRGDIEAREAVVGGAVYGAIRATDRVEVQPGATVHGDITTKRIAIAEGGILNGLIRMGETPAEPRLAARTEGRPAKPAPVIPVVRPSVPVARVAVPPRQGASYP